MKGVLLMAKFNERLKLLRRESGLSQQDFAKQLGTSKSSVNMYERGEREPGIETLEAIADYFNVDMDYLLGKSDHRSKSAWLEDIDNSIDLDILRSQVKFENLFPIEKELYVEAGAEIEADFCLRAKGDSMIRARIYDGDIVFIRKQSMVDNGEIAAVVIDDEATLKRVNYYPEKNLLILKAENPDYEDLVYTGEQLDHIIILGKAVAFQSDVR